MVGFGERTNVFFMLELLKLDNMLHNIGILSKNTKNYLNFTEAYLLIFLLEEIENSMCKFVLILFQI